MVREREAKIGLAGAELGSSYGALDRSHGRDRQGAPAYLERLQVLAAISGGAPLDIGQDPPQTRTIAEPDRQAFASRMTARTSWYREWYQRDPQLESYVDPLRERSGVSGTARVPATPPEQPRPLPSTRIGRSSAGPSAAGISPLCPTPRPRALWRSETLDLLTRWSAAGARSVSRMLRCSALRRSCQEAP